MAAIILEKFRTHNAKQFIEDFGETGSSNYIFIGRSHSWTDDNSPPAPFNAESEEVRAFEDMIALKKVSTTDVSHGLVRYNWTAGVVYDEYRDDYSSSNQTPSGANNFYDGRGYVVTSDYKVYKCLKTPKSGGAHADVGTPVAAAVGSEPSGTSTANPEITADGYQWKFMYQISASDVIKFVTNDFIPVKTLGAQTSVAGSLGALGSTGTDDGSAQYDVEAAAVDGGIYRYIITNPGSGYTLDSGTTIDVAVEGDGSGAIATLTFASGQLSSVTYKDASSYGSGYKRASFPTLDSTISGISGGSGATIEAVISPIHGHGANPIEELGGNYVVVNSRLEFSEAAGGNDFPTDNDFRQIGLIKNPIASSSGAVSTANTMTATRELTLLDASNIAVDNIITSDTTNNVSTKRARVISKTGNVIRVHTIVNGGGEFVNFANDDDVYINASGVKITDVASSGVSSVHPEMTQYTGQILYLENRGPVTRAADQIEDIKLIIEM
tara:strand:- start:9104 stop:10594 length:1491 start_codon:yes stop_codon:yes gene_type:complete